MNFNKEHRQNWVQVVGEIASIDVVDGTTKAGVPFRRGEIIVKGNGQDFIVDFFESKVYASGAANAKYDEVNSLQNGQVVKLSGQLEENKFYTNGNLISTTRVNLGFINQPREIDNPGLEFDITGYIVSPLREVKDKETGATKYWSLKLGQATYSKDGSVPARGASIVELTVNPNNTAAIQYIQQNMGLNSSARFGGIGLSTVVTKKETVQAMFGEDQERIVQTREKQFMIERGLQVEEKAIYTQEHIDALNAATDAYNATLQAEGSNKPAATATAGFGTPATSNSSSNSDDLMAKLGL